MELNKKKVVGARIKQARISRGYSMTQLADYIGVSRQAISQYELGLTEPLPEKLRAIAKLLYYPIDFFMDPINEVKENKSAVFYRSKKTTRKKDKLEAEEKLNIYKRINDYLKNFVDYPNENIPKYNYEGINDFYPDLKDAENAAKKLRDFWKLGNGPIINLTQVLQKNGILVTQTEKNGSNGKLDGFSCWIDNNPYIFLGTEAKTGVRVRFSLAHELGHLMMHSPNISVDFLEELGAKQNKFSEKLEIEANAFAGAFLLPEETFSKDIFSTSLEHFINLKKKWKVSIQVMIYRCENLSLLNSNQINYLKRQLTDKRYWRFEPYDGDILIEKPFVDRQAIDLLLDNNILTPSNIMNDLKLFTDEIEEYCFLEPGSLKEKLPDNIVELKNYF